MSTRKKTPDQGGPLRAAVLVYDPLADGAPRLVARSVMARWPNACSLWQTQTDSRCIRMPGC